MAYITKNTPEEQVASLVTERLSLIETAALHGLVDAEHAYEARGLAAMGLLDAAATNTILASGVAAQKALDSIAAAFAPGDVIELRALDPAGGGGLSFSGTLDDPAERAALEDFIRDHSGHRNLYFGINPRRADLSGTAKAASASDVASRRIVVLDFDKKDAPDTDPNWSRTVAELSANALLFLDSGNGFHVWLEVASLSEPELPASVAPLAAAMARLGADNMADPARITRLPFTPNLPTAAKRKRGAVICLASPVPNDPTLPVVVTSAAPSVLALCASLEITAQRLGLPGRGGIVAPSGASPASSGGEPKTGHPAPSLDLLRMALDGMPNTPGGAFDDRADWVKVAHAVKGASVAAGIEAAGRDAFTAWSQVWGGDPDEPGRVWEGIARPTTGWGTLMRILEVTNPAGAQDVRTAEAKAAFALQASQNVAALSAITVQPVQPSAPGKIPPRPWIYGRSYIRGFISVLIAPGGVGKSALAMVEAVAIATGRELLAGDRNAVAHSAQTVWYHNSEDSADEQQRRLAAVLIHFNIKHADLGGRLILTSGHDLKLRFAQVGQDGPELTPGTAELVVKTARDLKVDVFILDPLAAAHTLPENSNEAINLLMDGFRAMARDGNMAICLVHHTSKAAAMDMSAAGAAASRGASGLTDAARAVRQLVRMTEKEALGFGVQSGDRRDFIRVENGKANLTRADEARWLRLRSVRLGNGTADYPDGDAVQTVERWTPPTTQPGTGTELAAVQAALGAAPAPFRADPRSPDWAGYPVAKVLGLDVGAHGTPKAARTAVQAAALARVKAAIADWLRDGGLVQKPQKFETGKTHDCIFAGVPAILIETPDADADAGEDDPAAGVDQ